MPKVLRSLGEHEVQGPSFSGCAIMLQVCYNRHEIIRINNVLEENIQHIFAVRVAALKWEGLHFSAPFEFGDVFFKLNAQRKSEARKRGVS